MRRQRSSREQPEARGGRARRSYRRRPPRNGSFEPKLPAKRQTRLTGLDDKIVDYARGVTVRDISTRLSELYVVEIGRDTISRDAVLEEVIAWRTRPLDAVYPDRL